MKKEEIYFCIGCNQIHHDDDYEISEGDVIIKDWKKFVRSVNKIHRYNSQVTSSTSTAQNTRNPGKINNLNVNPTAQLPKGFKEGKCKCGNLYGYCGIDIGYCVKCIDKMETS
jgi:hypothetical protein